jgi:hypothetical protein
LLDDRSGGRSVYEWMAPHLVIESAARLPCDTLMDSTQISRYKLLSIMILHRNSDIKYKCSALTNTVPMTAKLTAPHQSSSSCPPATCPNGCQQPR